MVEVIYYVAASVDGFIATPDGGIEWLMPFENSGQDYGYKEFLASTDALIIGRRTFDQVLTFDTWPYSGKTTVVMTRRPVDSPPTGVIVSSDDPTAVVQKLVEGGAKRIWLIGGAELLRSFRAAGLVTEYQISTIPVFLGEGIPLFPVPGPAESARLVAHKAFPDGVLQAHWQVVRKE